MPASEDDIVICTELDTQKAEHTVKSKVATAMLNIMGLSKEIIAYDNIRATIKQKNESNGMTSADAREYNRLQTYLQTKILHKRTDKIKGFNV